MGTTWGTSRNQIASSNASVHFCLPLRVSAKLHSLENRKTGICKPLCRNFFLFDSFSFLFCFFFLRKNADLGFQSSPRKRTEETTKKQRKYKAPWRHLFLSSLSFVFLFFFLWFVVWFGYFLLFVCVFLDIFWYFLVSRQMKHSASWTSAPQQADVVWRCHVVISCG